MKNKIAKMVLINITLISLIGLVFIPSIQGNIIHQKNVSNNTTFEDVYQINQGERWALLVDEDRTIAPTKSIKTVLCQNGWEADHIKTYQDPNMTKKKLIDGLSWLADHSSNGDTVLVYICLHGYYGRFLFPDGDTMYYLRLNMELNKIKSQGMAVILHICHSGSAIPYLRKENRVIITSCEKDKLATSYDARLNLALQGFSDYEGNNDNFVSAEEVFIYTLEDEIGIDTPQMQDDYPGELILTTVDPTFVDEENIDIYHNHPYDQSWSASKFHSTCQSFKPLGDKVTKIKLLLRCIYTDAPLVVSIKENLYGNDIVSKVIPAEYFDDCLVWANRFFEIDFPDFSVIPNETYYIVCKCNSDQGYQLGIDNKDRDEYEGELYTSFEGGPWENMPNRDMIFIVYGEGINNVLPDKPEKPSGPTNGEPGITYTFSTSTTDPDGNQLYYKWDWGDGNFSEWFGPFDSGETTYASYSWLQKDNYEIKVKARDIHGVPSGWSDSITLKMLKNKAFNINLFELLFERFPNLFLILKNLLRL